ncbi:MAG: hypothetical protein JW767_08885 [Thermoleophilia bacterium]|nr:hypothetical protein [Thermoleophilia bacterium]
MTVRVLPTLKRLVEGKTGAAVNASGSARTRLRAKDFMHEDLTGSARRYTL